MFIDKDNTQKISVTKQADLLGIGRATVYYTPTPVDLPTLADMRAIDELYTKYPFYGSRRIATVLSINRKRTQRLMGEMGIAGICPKPKTTTPNKTHPVYPYLLRGMTANHPNHIWGTDITFVRMPYGYLYLTAFPDRYSRFVLSWRLSTTMEATFCIEAAQDALSKYHAPDYANSDQGSQYTSRDYIDIWTPHHTKISMDGRGRCMDNIFTERLWRTVKYEEVYLKEYTSVQDAHEQLAAYFRFYNYERPHQSLNYSTPAAMYFTKQKTGIPADTKQLLIHSFGPSFIHNTV